MEAWVKKIAVVTDCSSELGLCIIEELSRAAMITIAFAKTEKIMSAATEKLTEFIKTNIKGKIVLCKCDVTNKKQLIAAFEKIVENYGSVHVLVNNAFCDIDCNLSSGRVDDFRELVDSNVYSLVACIRLAAGYMIENKTRGHILNMNDLMAYELPKNSNKNVFIATKSTMTSLNEILRQEFRYLNANIKVTNIACGMMRDDELITRKNDLKMSDIAKVVTSILDTPEHLQIHEILLDSDPE